MATTTIAPGVTLTPGYLDRAAQDALLAAVRSVIAAAPLYVPRMPRSGKPMSVMMTNCGSLGWVTDERAAIAIRPRIRKPARRGRRSPRSSCERGASSAAIRIRRRRA